MLTAATKPLNPLSKAKFRYNKELVLPPELCMNSIWFKPLEIIPVSAFENVRPSPISWRISTTSEHSRTGQVKNWAASSTSGNINMEYRLNLQFKAWQANIGWLLHPDIKQHDRMRIADVGTGTGWVTAPLERRKPWHYFRRIWLRELAAALPSTCQLDGFDLSDVMFPRKDALPDNITFHHQNLLEPFPDEYLGEYDVVNVRLMMVALSSDEWEPAVRNLVTLLSTEFPNLASINPRSHILSNRARRLFTMDRFCRTWVCNQRRARGETSH